MAKAKVKKITGFQKRLLDIVRDAEDVKIAYYKRRHVRRSSLRVMGRLGVEENEGVTAIRRRILVSPDYALELLVKLLDDGFLSKTKLDLYTLSETAIESISRELERRGYVRAAVRRILRRQLAKRGYIQALREHRAPTRTHVLPPIIGYFR